MDLAINLFIFCVTAAITVSLLRKDGKWALSNARAAFRFFTVLSNVFCALSALCMCVAPAAHWAWLFKYAGTAAVTVTLFTVILFLAPSNGGYLQFIKGRDFFMHLATPILAILSFSLLEKRGMDIGTALIGMVPVLLYGVVYMYKVIYAPEGSRWDDFYGYNKGGKWPIAFAAMTVGTLLVCLLLMALQNI